MACTSAANEASSKNLLIGELTAPSSPSLM
jgi:hypothetical protein